MYNEEDHIETAKEGFEFGHGGDYKYRVLDRTKTMATHHTNSLSDAKKWFHKCRAHWIEQDGLSG